MGRASSRPTHFSAAKRRLREESIGRFDGNKKNAPCRQDAFFSLVGNLFGSRLAGVKFDNELFVDDGIDFLACGNTDDAAAEVGFVNQKPIGDRDDLGEFNSALGEACGFVVALDRYNIAWFDVHGRDVGLASIDGDMTMADHLTGTTKCLGEAHFLNDIVEAGFKELEEDFTGHTTAAAGDLEVAAELALQNSILVTELLLFGKGDRIIGLLAAGTFRPVLAGRIVFILECFG